MDAKEVIKIQNVTKYFRIYHEKKTTLVDYLISIFSPNKKMRDYETICVLKNINLSVKKGECIGIIGRNGSGKTTLLRIIASIIIPSSGRVDVNGRILPFIELGVGFNPELTGKENIFMYGSILGLSREQIRNKFESVIEFSGLRNFIDTKLKNYSSGMQARLAFSTALMNDPDIVLIDEVLAVGDNSFQKRCLNKMREFKKEKKTIVFVSHNLEQVKSICDKTILLDYGEIIMSGNTDDVISFYKEKLFEEDRMDFEEKIRAEERKIMRLEGNRKKMQHMFRRKLSAVEKKHVERELWKINNALEKVRMENRELYGEFKNTIDMQINEYNALLEENIKKATEMKKALKKKKRMALKKQLVQIEKSVSYLKNARDKLILYSKKMTYKDVSQAPEEKQKLRDVIEQIQIAQEDGVKIELIKELEKNINKLDRKKIEKIKHLLRQELKNTKDMTYKLQLTKIIKQLILEEMKDEQGN